MKLSLEQMKANRKLWVEALRSGKYRQGVSFLRNGDSYCCLGVLSDLAGFDWTKHSINSAQCAPKVAMDCVGLRTFLGSYGNHADDLADLNDSGKSFSEIADIIESEPEGLFIDEAAS